MDLSLDRITTLLSRLSDPQSRFPVIHVAGTNGKGSVTAYLDALLVRHLGLRTGRFNSPHLVEARDVCRVSGTTIDADVWKRAQEAVRKADSSEGKDQALQSTSFELLTAQALVAFTLVPAHQAPDVLIIEVGLGGRLDATNVFAPQQVLASVICPVDLDHQSILGDSLTAIATEKAGIVREHGLCVIADQRRPSSDGKSSANHVPEVDCTSIRSTATEKVQLGEAGSEVLEAIRKVCESRQARIVKAFAPWEALSGPEAPLPASPFPSPAARYGSRVQVTQRYAPVLFATPAKNATKTDSVTSMFPPASSSTAPLLRAQAGDSVVPGPRLILPRTRSAVTGATTALQTLFSIARDETPSALGRGGGDAYEELRLQIAFGLREGRSVEEDIQRVVEQTVWEGRSCWVTVPLRQVKEEVRAEPEVATDGVSEQATDAAQETPADMMQIDEPATEVPPATSDAILAAADTPAEATTPPPTSLTLLVDGAHNPSSALSLRAYLDACLAKMDADRGASAQARTCTWILAFSQGKAVRSMLEALFLEPFAVSASTSTGAVPTLADLSLADAPAKAPRKHRVAVLPFSTPVEGMPWVQPVSADELAAECAVTLQGGAEVSTFATLDDALRWAATDAADDIAVLCGSLYLVSDLYRHIGQIPAQAP